jgi:hypothetical protein
MIRVGELAAREMATGGDIWLYRPVGSSGEGLEELPGGIREQG